MGCGRAVSAAFRDGLDNACRPGGLDACVTASSKDRPGASSRERRGRELGEAKATEIKGEARGSPLYHFELWIDAPAEVKQRIVAVAYAFNTPAVMPQMQVSSEQKTGFRVSVGGLACAQDHRHAQIQRRPVQQVAVDGCRLLG